MRSETSFRTRARWLAVVGLVLVAAVVAYIAEARYGSTRYHLNGVAYDVPHRYEFSRQVQLPGLGGGPAEGLMLLLPAHEIAAGVPGYSRLFRGYRGPVEADMVPEIIDDAGARHFAHLYATQWSNFDARVSEGVTRRPEPTGGDRLVFSEGPPEHGNRSFYLVPSGDMTRLSDRGPPYCLASPDAQGRETYNCSYTIHRGGLTFDFSLAQENVGAADHIPDYLRARLSEWRR